MSDATAAEVKTPKSIVPAKYAGKYKGAQDAVSEFINAQSSGKDGFEFQAFFSLCRKNDIPEEKIASYEAAVEAKNHGAPGRARMTLGNMLRARARNNGKLVGLDGSETPFEGLKKPAASGAAAAAQAAATAEPADTLGGAETTDEDDTGEVGTDESDLEFNDEDDEDDTTE